MVSSNDGRIKTTTKHLRNSTYRLYDKWVERRKNLLHFTDVVDKLSLEEKKELMSLILKEVKVSRVNHEKGKAPAEAGAFNTMIRTSWFRVVVTINAMPSLPVTYDELTQKFVFTSKWLPLVDEFRTWLMGEEASLFWVLRNTLRFDLLPK